MWNLQSGEIFPLNPAELKHEYFNTGEALRLERPRDPDHVERGHSSQAGCQKSSPHHLTNESAPGKGDSYTQQVNLYEC